MYHLFALLLAFVKLKRLKLTTSKKQTKLYMKALNQPLPSCNISSGRLGSSMYLRNAQLQSLCDSHPPK